MGNGGGIGGISAPNLKTVRRAGHRCVARFRDFLRNPNRGPVVTWILDVAASISEGFDVFGRGEKLS